MTTTPPKPLEVAPARYSNPLQQAVGEFHTAFGVPNRITAARALPKDRIALRESLIHEESVRELGDAIDRADIIEVIDALIDSAYVALGAIVEMGYEANERAMQYTVVDPEDTKPLMVLASRYRFANEVQRLRAVHDAFHQEDAGVAVYTLSVIAGKALQALANAGIDPEPYFNEVHRANMSKLGVDGKPIYSRGEHLDGYPKGKVLKGRNYSGPDLAAIYFQQGHKL